MHTGPTHRFLGLDRFFCRFLGGRLRKILAVFSFGIFRRSIGGTFRRGFGLRLVFLLSDYHLFDYDPGQNLLRFVSRQHFFEATDLYLRNSTADVLGGGVGRSGFGRGRLLFSLFDHTRTKATYVKVISRTRFGEPITLRRRFPGPPCE